MSVLSINYPVGHVFTHNPLEIYVVELHLLQVVLLAHIVQPLIKTAHVLHIILFTGYSWAGQEVTQDIEVDET